jgi:hypothetical protein
MDANAKEEASRPLGVIGSLAAGFEVIGRNLWLITLPVLLDLLLWLGPRVSVAPLLEQLVAFMLSRPSPDPETARQVVQVTQLVGQFAERSNLFSLLSAFPLLNVPSLLAQRAPGGVSPLGTAHVLLTSNVLMVMAWAIVLVPIGLVLGFVYLNGLARWVRAMRSSDEQSPAQNHVERPAPPATPAPSKAEGSADLRSEAEGPALSPIEMIALSRTEGSDANRAEKSASGVDLRSESGGPIPDKGEWAERVLGTGSNVGRFIRVFLFAAGLLMAGMVIVPLWMLVVGLIVATAPPLGFLVWTLSIGLGSYFILHLLFVIPGVLIGGRGLLRAIWESVLLIHTQFPSVMGLVLLVVVIYQGLGFVWSLPAGDSWSLLVGILGNGCIATGLTAALFVFYQERVGKLPGPRQVAAKS